MRITIIILVQLLTMILLKNNDHMAEITIQTIQIVRTAMLGYEFTNYLLFKFNSIIFIFREFIEPCMIMRLKIWMKFLLLMEI